MLHLRKKGKKITALLLTIVMLSATALFSGCDNSNSNSTNESTQNTSQTTSSNKDSSSNSSTVNTDTSSSSDIPEQTTIKILHKGPKPDGWDSVYEKYLEETKDTINVALDITWVEHSDYKDKLNLEITAGGDWDLVFDASWIHLKDLAAEGYYQDLSTYFNNSEEYPGLAAAFSEDTMDANKWFGSMCYVPLFETYGNGIPCIWYRKDLAKEWGIGTDGSIANYDEMEQYWAKALDAGLIAYGASQSRGFFQQLSIRGEAFEGSADAGLELYSAGGLSIWTYIKDGELISYAVEGQGDEAFADFPEGWNYDFAADRYDTFAEWQKAGYIDPDSLSCNDYKTPFQSGLSASIIGTLDDYVEMSGYQSSWGIDDSLGFFVYVDSIRNMEEAAIPTGYAGNNGWCVPATSTKTESTMKFLDWMFASQENHDLIQLGIEGIDFEYGETEGTYSTLTDYSTSLGGYGFSWNPNYALISTSYTDTALKYREYELTASSFTAFPVLGFHFDSSAVDLSTAVAQCKAVTDMVSTVKAHGILTDGYGNSYDTMAEMLKANTDEALESGGQTVVDALIAQLKEYIASTQN